MNKVQRFYWFCYPEWKTVSCIYNSFHVYECIFLCIGFYLGAVNKLRWSINVQQCCDFLGKVKEQTVYACRQLITDPGKCHGTWSFLTGKIEIAKIGTAQSGKLIYRFNSIHITKQKTIYKHAAIMTSGIVRSDWTHIAWKINTFDRFEKSKDRTIFSKRNQSIDWQINWTAL